jgi:hypothetical protein
MWQPYVDWGVPSEYSHTDGALEGRVAGVTLSALFRQCATPVYPNDGSDIGGCCTKKGTHHIRTTVYTHTGPVPQRVPTPHRPSFEEDPYTLGTSDNHTYTHTHTVHIHTTTDSP